MRAGWVSLTSSIQYPFMISLFLALPLSLLISLSSLSSLFTFLYLFLLFHASSSLAPFSLLRLPHESGPMQAIADISKSLKLMTLENPGRSNACHIFSKRWRVIPLHQKGKLWVFYSLLAEFFIKLIKRESSRLLQDKPSFSMSSWFVKIKIINQLC